MKKPKIVVIGGGAAGFFTAINAAAANSSAQVVILEKSNKLLSKLKISGGGRCNTTHNCPDIVDLSKHYPRGQQFLKKAFHWFNANNTIEWFANRGIQLKTEADGRMFPTTNDSQTIIDCLLKEVNKYNIEILLNFDVKAIEPTGQHFTVKDNNGTRAIEANCVCIACGGFPKPSQFDWLIKLGHTIETPVPSLFTFNIPNNAVTELMGLSVEKATVKIHGTKLQSQGPVLITHWGLSGPAVLKLSAFGARELANKNYHFSIGVNWLKDETEQSLREKWPALRSQYASQKIVNKNPFGLPNRLWLYFLNICTINPDINWGDLNATLQNKLIATLTNQTFDVKGKTTFKEEFVTCGGIKLSEIDVNTMQSKIVPNLFFAGEIIDVDGITGGFNFQNAWTTGWIASQAIAQKTLTQV